MVASNASNKHTRIWHLASPSTSRDDGHHYYTCSLTISHTRVPANPVEKLCTVPRTSGKIEGAWNSRLFDHKYCLTPEFDQFARRRYSKVVVGRKGPKRSISAESCTKHPHFTWPLIFLFGLELRVANFLQESKFASSVLFQLINLPAVWDFK